MTGRIFPLGTFQLKRIGMATAVAILATALMPLAQATEATAQTVAAAPALELPFYCNTRWVGNSKDSNAHVSYEIDFNKYGTSDNEDLREPIHAAAAGTVVREGGESSDYGNFLEISHGGGYSMLYAHLDSKSVGYGDVVRQGELIGTLGNTDGNDPGIKAHLHFEYRYNGTIKPASFHGDPFDYATGIEEYVSQNCPTAVNRPSKSVNGDGFDDAIGVDPAGVAWFYRGKSGGGFTAALRHTPGWGNFSRIALNDSNADGWADLWAVSGDVLYYWHNRADGTFAASLAVGPGWSAMNWISFADVNGDDKADILARDGGNMYLYAGRGAGAFSSRTLVSGGWAGLLRHTAGDADGDGDADIWATNSLGELYFWKRNNGAYATAEKVGTGWNGIRQMVSMDINGDSKADLVGIRTSDNTLLQWLGTGTGTFGQSTPIGSGWAGFDLAVN